MNVSEWRGNGDQERPAEAMGEGATAEEVAALRRRLGTLESAVRDNGQILSSLVGNVEALVEQAHRQGRHFLDLSEHINKLARMLSDVAAAQKAQAEQRLRALTSHPPEEKKA